MVCKENQSEKFGKIENVRGPMGKERMDERRNVMQKRRGTTALKVDEQWVEILIFHQFCFQTYKQLADHLFA